MTDKMLEYSRNKKKLVCGVGVNDADYVVCRNGVIVCQYYRVWSGMLMRAYSDKFKKRCGTYSECSVCDDWLYFSKFKDWMQRQDWRGKELDKDLIVAGNKEYSPMFCVFVSKQINTFITENKTTKIKLTGAFFHKKSGRYQASCKNPFTKKLVHIGLFDSEIEASLAWRAKKNEFAQALAEIELNEVVSVALSRRYK